MGSLIIFDLDGTLLDNNGNLNTGIISKLRNQHTLAIASRNDKYHVLDILKENNVINDFEFICADFRPKKYMVRQIIDEYIVRFGDNPVPIFFIDDLATNLQNVSESEIGIICCTFESFKKQIPEFE